MFIIYSKVCAIQFRSVSVLRNMYLKKKHNFRRNANVLRLRKLIGLLTLPYCPGVL